MDIILRIIGIITLISEPKLNPTKFEVYAFDGRNKVSICGKFVPTHSAFIKVTEKDVVIDNWPWIPCADGKYCKLFPLDGDMLTIDPITTAGTFKADPSMANLPRLQDDYGVIEIKDRAEIKAISAAWLEIKDGTVIGDELLNEMMFTTVEKHLNQQQEIVVKSDKARSLTFPKASKVQIDLLNLPVAEAIAVPGIATHGADEEHFFLHYKVEKEERPKDCDSPGSVRYSAMMKAAQKRMPYASPMDHSKMDFLDVLDRDAASAACSNSVWP